MKKNKISFLDEKKINKKAKEVYLEFAKSEFVQNPIEAKFAAFQKTKKTIKVDDLI